MLKVNIIAVGRLGQGAEQTLFADYFGRAKTAARHWAFTHTEIDDRKAPAGPKRGLWETTHIKDKLAPSAALVALDERGKSVTSSAFASQLQAFEQDRPAVCFIIGGPDGLTDDMRSQAHHLISFGKPTWPHRLVRVMLMEQLYRAASILAGHPYHREG